jgi:hypothetical protein
VLMDAIGDFAPACDLFPAVDAGSVLVSLALLRDLARFRDQEPCGSPLAVILGCQWAGH